MGKRIIRSTLFFNSQPSLNKNIGLPTIVLPGTGDTQYPPQQKVFHMLKYNIMHDHYIIILTNLASSCVQIMMFK